jgi:ESS family glutamate:Na+ symporter
MSSGGPITISALLALTFGIVAYFLGAALTRRFAFLSTYSIPEPVSGGLVAAVLALLIVSITGRDIVYDLAARDALLVYFFTSIGLNARLDDLRRGGRVLVIMLALTIAFMVLQTFVGLFTARLFGLPPAAGVMLGTAALIGGHGTAIAWGPVISGSYGVTGGAELGIAMATVGLIVASVLGGPIAKLLIERRRLTPDAGTEDREPIPADLGVGDGVTSTGLMRAVLVLNIAILLGSAAHELFAVTGIKLPLFVPCLLAGILLSNTVPRLLPALPWPAGSAAMALIAEFSLSVFLAMSLMSMELWTLASSAGVLAVAVVLQALVAALFILFVVFPALGGNYFAAVMAAGSTGLMLGATPTAIANMNAVTQRYGPAPLAFIVLPLVSAFFVDIVNAFAIQAFLRAFG